MTYLVAFAVTLVVVAGKVIQQRNVEAKRKRLIPPTSMILQFIECAVYGYGGAAFLNHEWGQVFMMGLGAGVGTLVALWIDENWLVPKPGTIIPKKGTLRRVK